MLVSTVIDPEVSGAGREAVNFQGAWLSISPHGHLPLLSPSRPTPPLRASQAPVVVTPTQRPIGKGRRVSTLGAGGGAEARSAGERGTQRAGTAAPGVKADQAP
ncbi:hypothetical protein JCM9533A_66980 [Catenuloplanes niger JCM 9533]